MNLPTTKPNDRDIAWYIRECEDLRKRLESLAESDKKQTDDYVCVDREHGLYKRAPHGRDAVSADRLALALSLETVDQLERENAALRKTLVDADVLYQYGRDDGRREWANFATYIRKDEIVVLIDRAAFYAARAKENQS